MEALNSFLMILVGPFQLSTFCDSGNHPSVFTSLWTLGDPEGRGAAAGHKYLGQVGKTAGSTGFLGFSKKSKAALNPAMRHIQVKTSLAKILMKLGILTHSKHLTSMQQSKEKNPFKG